MAQNDETIRKVTYELHVQKSAQAESDVKQFADEVKASEEEITKTVKAEADKRNKAQKESLDKAAEDYAAYSEDVNSKNREFNDSLMGVAEGALKVGEGFVLMGLAAEEDLVKVVQTLAAVKGSVDAIRGGVEIYRNITAGVEAYNKAVLAAASAEGLLAAARLGGEDHGCRCWSRSRNGHGFNYRLRVRGGSWSSSLLTGGHCGGLRRRLGCWRDGHEHRRVER